MRPVRENARVAGLYSSATAVPPPATSTWPLGNSVAVCPDRATLIWPVPAQVFGGPRPEAVAAAAPLGNTGSSSPQAITPVTTTAAGRTRAAQRDFSIMVPSSQAQSIQGPAARIKRETDALGCRRFRRLTLAP